jgi:DNA-binding NarL/FixJ family response regulator
MRILLADDHEIVLEGIRTILGRAQRDWEICGEARNGKEAVEMVRALKPDLVVLDVTMPMMSGLQGSIRGAGSSFLRCTNRSGWGWRCSRSGLTGLC